MTSIFSLVVSPQRVYFKRHGHPSALCYCYLVAWLILKDLWNIALGNEMTSYLRR